MGNLLTDCCVTHCCIFLHPSESQQKNQANFKRWIASLLSAPKTHTTPFNNAELFYMCQLLKVFGVLFISSLSKFMAAAPLNRGLLISPVESVGDDAVVHKLPSPPELNRDVELENREADWSEMWGIIYSQPEERQENYPDLCPAAMSGCRRDWGGGVMLTGMRARAYFTLKYHNSIQLSLYRVCCHQNSLSVLESRAWPPPKQIAQKTTF